MLSSRVQIPWTLGTDNRFRGSLRTARTFACLRIAGPVAVPLLPSPLHVRSPGSLPTCLAGLVGQDSHLQDDASVFLEVLAPSFPYGPAFPGRTQTTFLAGIGIGLDDKRVFRVTFHPETSYFDFVGSYKPLLGLERADSPALAIDGTEMRLPGGDPVRPVVYYGFEPGPFTDALCAALEEPSRNHALIVEEINRGNCAAIFGDVFQLLDRNAEHRSQYAIRPSAPLAACLRTRLKTTLTELRLPRNLFIYATMNTSDQSLFPMDTAFKRRWSLEYVGISFDDVKTRQTLVPISETMHLPWWAVATALNRFIVSHTGIDDKQMGPYFVQATKGDQVSPVAFRSKVLFYLWNDIFRGSPQIVFAESIETYDSLVAMHRNNRAVFNAAVLDAISSLTMDPDLSAQ